MQKIKIVGFIFFFLFTTKTILFAQEKNNKDISHGYVSDKQTKEHLSFASIYIDEISSIILSDNNGYFSFPRDYEGKIHLTITSVGYQPLDTTVVIHKQPQSFSFSLRPSTYALKEVVVQAQEGNKGNSTSLIGKEAMQHIQPSSFADLLQLLPGHLSKEIDMSKTNTITMRQAGNDVNTSLGTAFVVDGTILSNDGNLQEIYGITNDDLSQRLTTSAGIDMRTISTDKIESVEVVRGIPSAQYGDLTAGMVKIELKNGFTPWEARVKADLKNKLFSVGKGFIFAKNGGALNIDADYTIYNADPRSDLTTYTRNTFSSRYENNFRLSENLTYRLQANISYTGSFDDVKKDPSSLSKDDFLKTSYNSWTFSTRGTFNLENSFFKQIKYGLSYICTEDKVEQQKLVSLGGTIPLTTVSKEEKSYETGYLPAEYSSKLTIDGKPVNFTANIDIISEFRQSNLFHSILYGAAFTYDKNKGKGALYDPYLPPYSSGVNIRARSFDELPALEKFSFYIEDRISCRLGNSSLSLQPGIRFTTLYNLDNQYQMKGKLYNEPRINAKYTFPEFKIFGKSAVLSLTGGAARLYKFPTMSQLYPDKLYADYIELNYYPVNKPDYRFAQVQTYIEDPVNYELEPAQNIKWETGFIFNVGGTRLDFTFFKESMDNGFSSDRFYACHTYRYFDASSVPNPQHKPTLDEFTHTDEQIISVYSTSGNRAGIYKTGIEYTLDLGKIQPIYTNIRLNGAWFNTQYKTNGETLRKPNTVINDRPYPFVGVYDYDSEANTRSQFNTNIYFDTHIPFLQMIFTTSIQNMWFETRQSDFNTGMPIAYLDNAGNRYPFDPAFANQGIYKEMVTIYNNYKFLKDRTMMASTVNLKLSKEIGKNIRLSCYFNNILSYLPDYTDVRGIRVSNRSKDVNPYFGAELNIKF